MVTVESTKSTDVPQRIRLEPADRAVIFSAFWLPAAAIVGLIASMWSDTVALKVQVAAQEKRLDRLDGIDVSQHHAAAAPEAARSESIQHLVGAVSP